jgi:hypothetical protein
MNQTATYHRRLGIVKRWLREAGWIPNANADGFEYTAIIERVRNLWYPTRRDRAENLVVTAAKLMRGDPVREAGRPPLYAHRLRIGQRVVVEDATSRREMTVTANNSARPVIMLRGDNGSITLIY